MRGILNLVLAGIFLGTIGIFVKLIGVNVSPFLLTFIRATGASILILLFLFIRREINVLKIKKHDLKFFILAGIGVAISFAFFIKALTLIPVANAVFLAYIAPVIVAIFASLFLKEKIGRYFIIAFVLMIIGIWFIYGFRFTPGLFWGHLFAIISAVGQSMFIVFMRFAEKRGYIFYDVVFWPLAIGSLFLIPFIFTEPIIFIPISNVVLYVFAIVFISTFLAYLFYAIGLKTILAHDAPIITTLTEPVSAVLLAWLILAEPLPKYIILGGALIIIANIIVQLEIRKHQA